MWPRCDQTPAWTDLATLCQKQTESFDLREAFRHDSRRFDKFSVQVDDIFLDLSKNWLDENILEGLLKLAEQCQLQEKRHALLHGAAVNITEGRAALHTALRSPLTPNPVHQQAHLSVDAMLRFAEKVRQEGRIRHVVNIGIGGSDLGPQLAVMALEELSDCRLHIHFVSNLDGHDVSRVLKPLSPRETLFILASKSFTTPDTLVNAQTAKDWFLSHGGVGMADHFVATTANPAAARAWGINTIFDLWDWVGGRYSLWSAIGLPIALALGKEHFQGLLDGAHAIDKHFAQVPFQNNLPVLLGLLDVWYQNFHRLGSRCVAPYHHGLRRLPAYLQQLEMESNGKGVDLQGVPLPFATSPVIWGEPGTNAQHAYFQMLHQGPEVIPVEFILVKKPSHGRADTHAQVLANGLAQAQALMMGKSTEEALAEKMPSESPHMDPSVLARHRRCPGNRPSSMILLDALTPSSLGKLIALYEHRVFVSGAIWGINSFDQWGVELGKSLAHQLLPRLSSGNTEGLDGSTAGLIRRLK